VNDKHDFEQLLRAHANKELTVDERTRLGVLAASDPARERAVGEFEELHRWMDAESHLAAETMAPANPSDEADESYRRLAQAAGRAEGQLRSKFLSPVHRGGGLSGLRAPATRHHRNRRLWIGAAVAAVAVLTATLVTIVLSNPGAPPLNPNPPDPRDHIGGQHLISINPVLSASDPRLSWDHVPGARSYDAKILDTGNAVVLARPEAQARSNEWRFTQAEYDVLKAHPGDLFLRVVARDGTGVGFASTGDRKLDVR
jgi:hypothetical protein